MQTVAMFFLWIERFVTFLKLYLLKQFGLLPICHKTIDI